MEIGVDQRGGKKGRVVVDGWRRRGPWWWRRRWPSGWRLLERAQKEVNCVVGPNLMGEQ